MGNVPRTVNGHNLFEVVSGLQKAIRRGQVDDALYWATDMDLSGFSGYLWRRLFIIACEDIGLANPDAITQVNALFNAYHAQKPSKNQGPKRLMLAQAVIVLATSPKSRLVDDAMVVHYWDHENQYREVPDYALDKHTSKGRSQGRGAEHFAEEGGQLATYSKHPWLTESGVFNPYTNKAMELEASKAENRKPPEDAGPAGKQDEQTSWLDD